MPESKTVKGQLHSETRYIVIYGYTRQELSKVMKHFSLSLPSSVKVSIENCGLVSKIVLTGLDKRIELLRFRLNKFQQTIHNLFEHETISLEDKTVAQVLGDLLRERELSVSAAESCTGGNIAHRITQVPGSSAYFLGSIVSYANEVKESVLQVPHDAISQHGAVSREVVEAMAQGAANLFRSDCALATSGIAGPEGGTRFKPVGTVWIGVKYADKLVTECVHFQGNRDEVIESATNHAMVMLINLLRDCYEAQDDYTDE